jgi:methyl-accepting chemotaxis protein
MLEGILKAISSTGNIYLIIITILCVTLFFFIKYYFSDRKRDSLKNRNVINSLSTDIKKEINNLSTKLEANDDDMYDMIKEIQSDLKKINDNIDKLTAEQRDKMKDFQHQHEKISERITDNFEIVKQMKEDVTSLKFKVELMLVQTNNSSRINKGL